MRRLALRVPTGLAWLWAALALAAPGADAPAVFAGASSEGVPTHSQAGLQELDGAPEREPPRLRTTELDFAGLRALRQAAASGRPSRTRLNLFEDAEFDWVVERTASTERGYSLSGPLSGMDGGTATLVVNDGVAVGSAWTPDGAYRIRTVGRMQIIERVQPSRAARCEASLRTAGVPDTVAQTDSAAPEDDGSEIDVLVVYTPEARRRAGGHRAILADVDHSVAWTNEAYATSDVVHRVRLVGASEVDYEELEGTGLGEPVSGHEDYLRLGRQGDGHMDEVHVLRDRLAADAVVLLTTTTGGRAGQLGPWAMAGVGEPDTFAHELGHVMGIAHEREAGTRNWPFPYSHGYELRGVGDYQTIMVRGGGNLPRFSNPRQRFRGVPLGVPGEEPTDRADGPADAARSMNETRRQVANFRRSATRCRYRLSASPGEVPAAGGSYTLRVEADAGCPWTARSADGFTTVTSAASGTGDGAVAYRVPANDGWQREAALAVAGRMHVAVQQGGRPVKPVCERTAEVREMIEEKLEADCAAIGPADLARIAELDFFPTYGVQPALGDFDGLSNLGYLAVTLPDGGDLPVGVFDGLATVATLELYGADFSLRPGSFRGLRNVTSLQFHYRSRTAPRPGTFEGMPRLVELHYRGYAPLLPGTFEGLSSLRNLYLVGEIAHLPAGALRGLPNLRRLRVEAGGEDGTSPTTVEPGLFDGLPNLDWLRLRNLAKVPEGLFAGLSSPRTLILQYNAFTSLPPRAFEGLSSLDELFLDNGRPGRSSRYRHELSTLPPGLFSGLSSLTYLYLGNAGLRDLPSDAFREVGATLAVLYLPNNKLDTLDAHAFDGLSNVYILDLAHNRLATLPPGVFDGLPDLRFVDLRDNQLTTLPPGVFDKQPDMSEMSLQDNRLAALRPDAFQNLGSLRTLRLHGNQLATLPPGLFGLRVEAGATAQRLEHGGFRELTLHGNPGAPFALAFDPVVTSAPWQRPVRVAARMAEGAPIAFEVAFDAAGGLLGAESAAMAPGALLSDSLAVHPAGRVPTVVRIADLPDAPRGTDCVAIVGAGGWWCPGDPQFTGFVLEAGPPLVLNGVIEQREFDGPAEIDLAYVFLEFDDSAIPTLSVRSSDTSVATAELAGTVLKISPANPGTATITVTATASNGATATRTFSITVPVAERRFMRGWRLTLLNDEEDAP